MLDRRYERMLDKKERREFEKEKLRGMAGREKLEYLWMYYKAWLLVPVGIAAAVWLGVLIYRGKTEEVLLQVVVTDSTSDEFGALEDGFKSYIKAEGKRQTVRVNSSLSNGTYQGEIAFSTLIGVESVDVVLCTEEFYEAYSDVLELQDMYSGGAAGGWLAKAAGLPYEPVCVCIAGNAPDRENAQKFVQMLEDME